MMPNIYLRSDLYDAIVRAGQKPAVFVNDAVEKELAKKGLKK